MRVAHGAAHDAAQHIAAAFVGREHAVGDQEARGAQMIGDDARARLVRRIGGAADVIVDGGDQRAEEVDVVVVVHALQHGGDALEPHAGVDRGARQGEALARRDLLELHEDEVPDLDEAVAVGIGRARRPAGDPLAVVVENLRAGAAGAGIAHRPKIVGAGNAHDPGIGEPGDLLPQAERLVVIDIDGHHQPLGRQAEFLGDQVPRQLDRALLEIVAEGEIAEHLEEGVVARGVADIVEVVVLAAGAHALLRGDGARKRRLRLAGEIVLELHHAGIGEHQGRVVARHERARRDALVPVLGEIVQERCADVVDARHRRTLSARGNARPLLRRI